VRLAAAVVVALPLVAGCALRSDVTKLRLQMNGQERAAAERDSAARANLAAIARLVQGILDSLSTQQAALTGMKGDLRVDLYNIQQQLVAVQELTGQSQQRLTELRAQLEQRSEQLAAQAAAAPASPDSGARGAAPGAPPPAAGAAGAPTGAAAGQPAPDQLMELGLQQLRRGSPATARTAFAEFLKLYPSHPRAGDAWFFVGESWTAEQRSDSAAAAYLRVVQRFPSSGHVAAALYKLGMIAAAAGRREEARAQFNQLIGAYPLSEEAALAREQLRTLGAAAPAPARPPH
jgi:tol-pal system protein YbgF